MQHIAEGQPSKPFTQPYVLWPIIGALVLVIGLLAAYTLMLRGELSRRQAESQNTTVMPSPSPAQAKTISPRPTEKAGTDVDNVYTNTREITYSFEHIDGYKVITKNRDLTLEKILESGETQFNPRDPNAMTIHFVNVHKEDRVALKNDDFARWVIDNGRAPQCYSGSAVTSIVYIGGKEVRQVLLPCSDPYSDFYQYFLRLNKNGDYLWINTRTGPDNEQLRKIVTTFSLFD